MDSPFKGANDIFQTKEPFEEAYHPEEILERDEEIETFAAALQDVLDGFGPPNVFIYGQTGVGKTATTHKVTEYLEADAIEAGVNLTVFSINCNKRDTTYKVITHLANELYSEKTFKQGHHPDTLWDRIYTALDELRGSVLVVLDEIDKLGEDEELLYEFPRANAMGELEHAKVGIIGISNNFKFRESLSPRVKSTLTEREIQFSPYDADELRTILDYYADLVFYENVISDDVVPLCAAFTAQDTGDARMGLDLLETAGDIARHEDADQVVEEHVRIARSQVDRANTERIVTNRLTVQMQTVLVATTFLDVDQSADAKVKTIYSFYKDLCNRLDIDVLSESRVRDHLDTLDMFGLLETEEVNLGRRGGRSYIYSIVDEPRVVIETLYNMDRFENLFGDSAEEFLDTYEADTRSDIQTKLGL
ncbi:Cdc6/Cdc18 family protein [Halorubrum sp. AJ67]|uniref:Cdc6/Cdc18 family protein n=1 Tax=Halorubrum sp. AJ67 TaxID=1173487 RepID=UPI0003DB979D|nr:orc1/cdc6 family replication initiation protein [Halorubrum sp. AJ67]CDK40328.1 ORC1-type DNA replication protein [Halorubrum sp. AJ67]